MLSSKEIQEQMRKKVSQLYLSEKGDKFFSKDLGLQQGKPLSTKHGALVNLPRSSWPTEITPNSTAMTHPGGHRRQCQCSWLQHKKESRAKTLNSMANCSVKKNIKACLNFARKHHDDPRDFWENALKTNKTRVELFESCVSHYYDSGLGKLTGITGNMSSAVCQTILNVCLCPQAEINLGFASGQGS